MGRYVSFDGISGTGKDTVIGFVEKVFRNQGLKVSVFNEGDSDPLRSFSVPILGWCKKFHKDRHTVLLALFAAGKKMMEPALEQQLAQNDIVLRNRSAISSVAYQSSSDFFTIEELWSLYFDEIKLLLPDLAVIVDADPLVAQSRVEKRTVIETGISGKISGDLANRLKIRENFLSTAKLFSSVTPILVVDNGGDYTSDQSEIDRRVEKICQTVIVRLLSITKPPFHQFLNQTKISSLR